MEGKQAWKYALQCAAEGFCFRVAIFKREFIIDGILLNTESFLACLLLYFVNNVNSRKSGILEAIFGLFMCGFFDEDDTFQGNEPSLEVLPGCASKAFEILSGFDLEGNFFRSALKFLEGLAGVYDNTDLCSSLGFSFHNYLDDGTIINHSGNFISLMITNDSYSFWHDSVPYIWFFHNYKNAHVNNDVGLFSVVNTQMLDILGKPEEPLYVPLIINQKGEFLTSNGEQIPTDLLKKTELKISVSDASPNPFSEQTFFAKYIDDTLDPGIFQLYDNDGQLLENMFLDIYSKLIVNSKENSYSLVKSIEYNIKGCGFTSTVIMNKIVALKDFHDYSCYNNQFEIENINSILSLYDADQDVDDDATFPVLMRDQIDPIDIRLEFDKNKGYGLHYSKKCILCSINNKSNDFNHVFVQLINDHGPSSCSFLIKNGEKEELLCGSESFQIIASGPASVTIKEY